MAYKAFTFRIKPNSKQQELLDKYTYACRSAWNRVLSCHKQEYLEYKDEILRLVTSGNVDSYEEAEELLSPIKPQPSRKSLFNKLKSLKKEYPYLEEPYSQVTQQKIQDLSGAFERFFKNEARYPQFKKKYYDKSGFRYPQGYLVKENGEIVSSSKTPVGFELNFQTLRVKLPGIGSMRFLPHQEFKGIAKSITVKNDGKYWQIIILAEYEDEDTSDLTYDEIKNAIGIDVGVAITLAVSNGKNYKLPTETIKQLEDEIAVLQRRLKHKTKGSRSYKRMRERINARNRRITNIRKDFAHKTTTTIANNQRVVAVEDLRVKDMSKSARGTVKKPGKRVSQKAGLNRSIRRAAWAKIFHILAYKLKARGGVLVKVDPKNTSITCSKCHRASRKNRKSQAEFHCVFCNHSDNADHNASVNISEAGRALLAAEANSQGLSALKGRVVTAVDKRKPIKL